MKASAICAGLVSAFALFTSCQPGASASGPSLPSCKASIGLAELAAIGSTHRYAEYVLYFVTAKGAKGDLSIHFTASTDAGATTSLVVSGFEAGANMSSQGGERAVLVVLPSAGVRTFAIDSIETAGDEQPCLNVSFTLSTLTYSTSASFDDAASWVTLDKPAIVSLSDADFTSRIDPNYPDLAKEENIQGDVDVDIVIGPDGGVEAAWVKESSGSRDLDGAAVSAARKSTFTPAHLPAAYGGLAVGSIYYVIYTFALDS